MKKKKNTKITQSEIAKKLGTTQSSVSKYLNGSVKISLKDSLKVEPLLPHLIFIDGDLQKKYLGKSYTQDNDSIKKSNTSRV